MEVKSAVTFKTVHPDQRRFRLQVLDQVQQTPDSLPEVLPDARAAATQVDSEDVTT